VGSYRKLFKTGSKRRVLLPESGAWSSVYYYFDKGSRDDTIRQIQELLRQQLREQAGRNAIR
jgi:hypothetical protein